MSMKRGLQTQVRQMKAEVEANRTPGSVMIRFLKPVVSPPWWRGPRPDEFVSLYSNSIAEVRGDVVIVHTQTAAGRIVRCFNWRDVDSITSVPPIPGPESTPSKS